MATERMLTITAHAAVLAVWNQSSVLLGFAAFQQMNQRAVQLPVAAFLSVVGSVVWMLAVHRSSFRRLWLTARSDGLWIYMLAIPLGAVIFIPLHFLAQGYLTSWGNVAALAAFQGIVNALGISAAIGMVWRASGEKTAAS